MKLGTKFKHYFIETINTTIHSLVIILDFPFKVKWYFKELKDSFENNKLVQLRTFLISLVLIICTIIFSDKPLFIKVIFALTLLIVTIGVFFKIKELKGNSEYINHKLLKYVKNRNERIQFIDRNINDGNPMDLNKGINNINNHKTTKIRINKESKYFDNLEYTFKKFFQKHLKKIDGQAFLFEATDYLNSNQTKYFNIDPKYKSKKLNKQEREDLTCVINYCLEKKIFIPQPNENSIINSAPTIADGIRENYPSLHYSKETIRKDLLNKELVLSDALRKEFNYYLGR